MGEENLSEDFRELLQNLTLNEKAREAIRIISKGGTPSPNQLARPGLIDIIKFFMTTYQCTNEEEKIEENEEEANPYTCPKCDKEFSTVEDWCQHAATIIDLLSCK